MRIIWSAEAVRDLASLRAYIAEESPEAAQRTVLRIVQIIEDVLPTNPHMGRPGRVPGTRELVVARTPYIVPYRVRDKTLEILRVHHGARRWPETV